MSSFRPIGSIDFTALAAQGINPFSRGFDISGNEAAADVVGSIEEEFASAFREDEAQAPWKSEAYMREKVEESIKSNSALRCMFFDQGTSPVSEVFENTIEKISQTVIQALDEVSSYMMDGQSYRVSKQHQGFHRSCWITRNNERKAEVIIIPKIREDVKIVCSGSFKKMILAYQFSIAMDGNGEISSLQASPKALFRIRNVEDATGRETPIEQVDREFRSYDELSRSFRDRQFFLPSSPMELGQYVSNRRIITQSIEKKEYVQDYLPLSLKDILKESNGNIFVFDVPAYLHGCYEIGDLQILDFSLWLMDALKELHRQGQIHNDVKCDNVLLNPNTGGIVLTDFGRTSPPRSSPDAAIKLQEELHYLSSQAHYHEVGPFCDIWGVFRIFSDSLLWKSFYTKYRKKTQDEGKAVEWVSFFEDRKNIVLHEEAYTLMQHHAFYNTFSFYLERRFGQSLDWKEMINSYRSKHSETILPVFQDNFDIYFRSLPYESISEVEKALKEHFSAEADVLSKIDQLKDIYCDLFSFIRFMYVRDLRDHVRHEPDAELSGCLDTLIAQPEFDFYRDQEVNLSFLEERIEFFKKRFQSLLS